MQQQNVYSRTDDQQKNKNFSGLALNACCELASINGHTETCSASYVNGMNEVYFDISREEVYEEEEAKMERKR